MRTDSCSCSEYRQRETRQKIPEAAGQAIRPAGKRTAATTKATGPRAFAGGPRQGRRSYSPADGTETSAADSGVAATPRARATGLASAPDTPRSKIAIRRRYCRTASANAPLKPPAGLSGGIEEPFTKGGKSASIALANAKREGLHKCISMWRFPPSCALGFVFRNEEQIFSPTRRVSAKYLCHGGRGPSVQPSSRIHGISSKAKVKPMLNSKLPTKGLVLVLLAFAPRLAVSQCVKDSDPGPYQTTCGCTGQKVITTSCQAGYSGEDCAVEIPGNYCGSEGHVECYVGYAYSSNCTLGVKASAKQPLPGDGLGANSPPVRGAKPPGCSGDPEVLIRWLETAPGFPERRGSGSRGL
jgi:hypothetical protein